jgi:hypothetical protein
MKKDYIKRMGNIYALHIQRGGSEAELMEYTERVFSYLYKKEKVIKHYDTRRESENRIQ